LRSNGDRILLTGGAGVLGRALRPALARAGFEVRVLDRALGSAQDLLTTDLPRILRGCSGILHLAGCSRVAHAEADPEGARRDNVRASGALLDAALRQPRPPWFIFTSSREVYGHPPSLPATEATPLQPANVYGTTKAAAEQLVAQARAAGLRALTLRLANVYGAPGDHADRLVPAFLAAARAGKPLEVRGPRRSLDLLHVDDAILALISAVRRLSAGENLPSPLNLCSGQEVTLGELAARVVALTSSASPIHACQPPHHEVARFVGDNQAARRAIGWEPTVGLDEGLRRLLPLPSTKAAAPLAEVST